MDWKEEINERIRKRKEAQNKLDAEKQAKEVAIARQEGSRRFKSWQESFRCHVCDRSATEPGSKSGKDDTGYPYTEVDWDIPGDLTQCPKCHNWACEDHFHNDICYKCYKYPNWQIKRTITIVLVIVAIALIVLCVLGGFSILLNLIQH